MRIPMKGGDEHDALSGWRKVFRFRPGQRKAAKRSYARRLRKWFKATLWAAVEDLKAMEGKK